MAKQYRTALIIEGDASGGVRAIKATEEQLEKLNRETRQSAKDSRAASAGWKNMTDRATALTAAVGLSVGGIAAMTISQTRAIAETAALARTLEISTGTLQEWQYAGEQVGINADKMGDIFKDVSDKIGDFAATGGGEAADLFEQLNLDINKLIKLAPDQQLLAIANAVNQIDDPARRVFFLESIADDASRLLPLMENNARALRAYSAEARSLGVALDSEDVARAVEADRAMKQLTATAQGLTNQLAVGLAPGLSSVTDSLTTFIREAGGAEEVLVGIGTTAGAIATVYLARRLGPNLYKVGKTGFAAGTQIAQGMAIAVGAAGRLNQALVVTQGRIAATAAAGRGLSSAMTLLGGPAGVAILAAGAIYTFREELGLVRPEITASADAVATLTGRLDNMNQAAAELQLTTLIGKLAELKAQAKDTGQAYLDIGRDEPISGGGFLGVDVSSQVAQFQKIGEATSGARQEMANVEAAIALVEGRLGKLKEQGARAITTLQTLSDTTGEAEQAAREYESSLASLMGSLYPLKQSQREYRESVDLLTTAFMKGDLSQQAYEQSRERLTQGMRSSTSVAEAYGLAADKTTQRINRSAQDLGFTFQSAFEDAIIGGQGFRQVLGGIAEDIARIALRKSVSEPFANWLGTAISGISSGFFGGSPIKGGFTSEIDVPGWAGGGYTGPGGKFEPAGIVHAGEYVVQKDVVERPGMRDFLDRLNTSKGYASGGYVGPAPLPAAINHSSTASSVTIPIEVNVTAQPGMSSQDATRQGSEIGRALKATVLTIIQNEKRPGGALASVRG